MKKRFIFLLCVFFLIGVLLVSCETPTPPAGEEGASGESTPEESTPEESTPEESTPEETTPEDSTPAECAHEYALVEKVDALALRDGTEQYVCSLCQDSYVETIPATKSIKILALGNSFTVDGTHHLWNICKDGGVENVIVGNLYIGNCTLDKHWANISDDKPAYTYYKNTGGEWVTTNDFCVEDALKQEEWDYIILHQTSGSAGFADGFVHLNKIIRFFNENKTNPNAKIIWHMPWAYQSDSTHAEFPKYGQNQLTMYQMIVDRVKEQILTRDTISMVIPSGTAIQNLRTSYVGDYVTRDGYHLDYGFGRYTAALTWFSVLTGGDISVVDWIPPKFPDVTSFLPVIRESVAAAVEKPFEITTSSLTSEVVPVPPRQPIDPSAQLNPADSLQADTALAAAFGVDLTKYQLLTWEYLENTFWNCMMYLKRPAVCTSSTHGIARYLPTAVVSRYSLSRIYAR